MNKCVDFQAAPAHLIRRAHQLAVAIFMEETRSCGVTPIQFEILSALLDDPGIDQITLAARVAFDAATSGSVVGRLEAKGWIRREFDPQDRRRKLLWLTTEGARMSSHMQLCVSKAQVRILSPLDDAESQHFARLLAKLVRVHEAVEEPLMTTA